MTNIICLLNKKKNVLIHCCWQLLYQEPNPGIEYEYSFPKDVSLPQGDSYNWIYGSWSDCTATCGGGRHIIFFLSLKINSSDFDLLFCFVYRRSDEKCQLCQDFGLWSRFRWPLWPSATAAGQQDMRNKRLFTRVHNWSILLFSSNWNLPNLFLLMFKRWFIGNWTKCSSNCQAGVQHRTVYCQQVVSDSKQSVADDEICINSNGPKPSASQPCNEDAVCPTFHIGNWGPVKIIKLLTKFISLIFVKFDFEISATNCAEKGNVVEKLRAIVKRTAKSKSWKIPIAKIRYLTGRNRVSCGRAKVSTGSSPLGLA